MESLTLKCIFELLSEDQIEEFLDIFKKKWVWIPIYQRRNKVPIVLDYCSSLDDAVNVCLENIRWNRASNGRLVYELTDDEVYSHIYKDDIKESLRTLHHFEDMFGKRWMICKAGDLERNFVITL